LAAFLLFVGPTLLHAQLSTENRWSVHQQFQGSSGEFGQILRLDTGITYNLNRRFYLDVGLPYYFVRDRDVSDSFNNGIGNAYATFGLVGPEAPLRYGSTIEISVPTGNEDAGFSTGKVTVDWNNSFSVPMGRMTPFANLGLANTVSDTSFFTRPFNSLGLVTHIQGGAQWFLTTGLSAGASGYGVLPAGDQTIVSRTRIEQPGGPGMPGSPFEVTRTTGDAELARDHGLSSWLRLTPASNLHFLAGYTRSTRYSLDTVFFGVGWRTPNF